MSEPVLKRITDGESEKKGFILYTDEDDFVLKLEIKNTVLPEVILETIKAKGIAEKLVDHERVKVLTAAFNKGEPVRNELIGQGKKVRHGIDGKMEFIINMGTKKVEVKDVEGHVDFRDLNLIKEIHSGEPIMKVFKADPGEEGLDIYGKTLIPVVGKRAKIRLGANVRHDEDAELVYATKDGHVEFVDPLISVKEEFEVHKDVDFTIGNLKFIGTLIFEKNIPEGYTMEAGKDIIVKGICTGSTLKAKNDIVVENGIVGNDKSRIECEGMLKAKFANEATIVTRGGVEIYYEVVRSNIKTNGYFSIPNGAIRGGEICALMGAKIKEIGTPLGNPTTLIVGVDFSVDERIGKLQKAIGQLDEEIKKLQVAIDPFLKNKMLLIKAPESKKSAVKTILTNIEGHKKKIKQIEAMIQDQESKRYQKSKEVEIDGAILEDVTIQIGNKKKLFSNAGKRKGKILYDKQSFEIVFSKS